MSQSSTSNNTNNHDTTTSSSPPSQDTIDALETKANEILQHLNTQYNNLAKAEIILRQELDNLQKEQVSLEKALAQSKETGREQMEREKSNKFHDEALKNLHDVLMAEDDHDDDSSSTSDDREDGGIGLGFEEL